MRAALRRTPCDVLLLDLQMERNALRYIASLAKLVKVVVVTMSERPEDALTAVRLGACAVVFKRVLAVLHSRPEYKDPDRVKGKWMHT